MPAAERAPALDLDAYLRRVGYTGELQPSPQVLDALHLAHARRIAFENLDVLLGRRIALDLASLQAKLVDGGRGGYCFEQNTLFAEVLRAVGFEVQPLAARVRYRNPQVAPRTHMLLLAGDGSDRRWLADVGFGAEGLLLPVPFVPGASWRQFLWTYRIVAEADEWLLQSLRDGRWEDLYAFDERVQLPVDYELANHYTSTHPDSKFVRTLTVQLPSPRRRRILRGRELTDDYGSHVVRRRLDSDEDLRRSLVNDFALRLPDDVRVPGVAQ